MKNYLKRLKTNLGFMGLFIGSAILVILPLLIVIYAGIHNNFWLGVLGVILGPIIWSLGKDEV